MRQHPRTTQRARTLRRDATKAEVVLWQTLRGRGLGWRFRRQHPIAGYIADFCCVEVRLVVEIDGASHEWRFERDVRREAVLTAYGYQVMRFAEREVYENLAGVIEAIENACGTRRSTLEK